MKKHMAAISLFCGLLLCILEGCGTPAAVPVSGDPVSSPSLSPAPVIMQMEAPQVPAGLTARATAVDAVLASWTAVDGATAYELAYTVDGNPEITLPLTRNTSCTLAGLPEDAEIRLCVRAVSDRGGMEVYSAYSEPVRISLQTDLKYVFLFIGDGMGSAQVDFYTEYLSAFTSDLPPMDGYVSGTVHTNDANGEITDSAAAATAIASGFKTAGGMLNLSPDGATSYTTLAEALHTSGTRVGVVTSVPVNHATPAGFYAHQQTRTAYSAISEDLFLSGFEYFAGADFLGDADIAALAAASDYTVVRTGEPIPDAKKLIVLHDNAYQLDRTDGWSLASEVTRAIEHLTNENGFFLMVEGGRIDYACHANDGPSYLAEMMDFMDAVRQADLFMAEHPLETLVLVTADHETGALGALLTEQSALLAPVSQSEDRFAASVTPALIEEDANDDAVLAAVLSGYPMAPLKDDETAELLAAYAASVSLAKGESRTNAQKALYGSSYDPLAITAARLFSTRTGLSFGSVKHTGSDVDLFARGVGETLFSGSFENSEIRMRIETARNGG